MAHKPRCQRPRVCSNGAHHAIEYRSGAHRYIYRWAAGREEAVLDAVYQEAQANEIAFKMGMIKAADCFDFHDAAVVSEQVGRLSLDPDAKYLIGGADA